MTIHPVDTDDAVPIAPDDTAQDGAPYDTVWTEETDAAEVSPDPVGLEVVMLQDGKIYVVLAVVLVIWFGILYVLYRTDRRIDQLERQLGDDRSE